MKQILFLVFILFFLGCSEDTKQKKSYNAKELLDKKCSACHNLNLPPKISKEELAPPMMAISHHVISMITVRDESQRVPKAVEFVKEYVISPDISKSFCDKESLEHYGVMPSQKGKVTPQEVEAIAYYMFRYYTQENLTQAQEVLQRFNAMSDGEKLAHKYHCFGCHKIDKKMVGPSFKMIAKRYKNSSHTIVQSIQSGSHKKWENGTMPPFKNIDKSTRKQLAKWIITL